MLENHTFGTRSEVKSILSRWEIFVPSRYSQALSKWRSSNEMKLPWQTSQPCFCGIWHSRTPKQAILSKNKPGPVTFSTFFKWDLSGLYPFTRRSIPSKVRATTEHIPAHHSKLITIFTCPCTFTYCGEVGLQPQVYNLWIHIWIFRQFRQAPFSVESLLPLTVAFTALKVFFFNVERFIFLFKYQKDHMASIFREELEIIWLWGFNSWNESISQTSIVVLLPMISLIQFYTSIHQQSF